MMRDSQLKGRARLRGLLAGHQETAEAMAAERERFAALANPSAAPAVFSSFNLFPTPSHIAAQVCLLAEIGPAHLVLEPSAGTGQLLRAVETCARLTAVEIDAALCGHLRSSFPSVAIFCADFLEWDGGRFDRVVMNPPFKMGRDVKHITRAASMLAPGGRLVSICANGPRQRAALQPIATAWHPLPADSFKCEGTRVETAIVVIDR
jgi:phospholipid N-methyltransferase